MGRGVFYQQNTVPGQGEKSVSESLRNLLRTEFGIIAISDCADNEDEEDNDHDYTGQANAAVACIYRNDPVRFILVSQHDGHGLIYGTCELIKGTHKYRDLVPSPAMWEAVQAQFECWESFSSPENVGEQLTMKPVTEDDMIAVKYNAETDEYEIWRPKQPATVIWVEAE